MSGAHAPGPGDLHQLKYAIGEALATETPIELVGAGSKRALGRPLQLPRTLDLSGLSGIRDYEPSELVLTAGAGTPLAEIEAALGAARQMLAFEPPDWSGLLGNPSGVGRQTLGGVLACNLAGPRRLKAGAARDHFLGFRGVSGRAEIFKAGGKVVKNVTGYDLPKLMAGSFGTLAALEEVTVKVLPRPDHACTILLAGLTPAMASRRMSEAVSSPHDVSGAAYLPPECARRVGALAGLDGGVAALRLEGPEPSVAFRRDRLSQELASGAEVSALTGASSEALWASIRDASFLPVAVDTVIWRISVAPSRGAEVAQSVAPHVDASWFLDWAGGLVWIALEGHSIIEDGGAARIRAAIRGDGGETGHAMLMRASTSLRVAVPVFEPLSPGLAALAARVKAQFDPKMLLNPGRMVEGS